MSKQDKHAESPYQKMNQDYFQFEKILTESKPIDNQNDDLIKEQKQEEFDIKRQQQKQEQALINCQQKQNEKKQLINGQKLMRPKPSGLHRRNKNRQIITDKTVRNLITYFNSEKQYGLLFISRRLGLSLRKVNQARNQYFETRIIKTTEQLRKLRMEEDGQFVSTVSKRFREAAKIIKELLEKQPTISAAKIQKELLKRNVSVKQRSINHILHKQGYVYRRLGHATFSKNTPEVIQERFQYTQELKLYNIDQIVFVGQSTFSVGRVGRHGWIKKDESANDKTLQSPNNISVLAVANFRGIIASIIKIGPIEAGQVFNLLIDNILPVIKQTDALVIGTLKVSSAEQIKGYFRDHNLMVKDIPSFSPQLNPLQGFYSEVKVNFRRNREERRLKDPEILLDLAKQLIQEQKNQSLIIHFKKMKEQFRIAQRKGDFEHKL